MKSKQAVQNMSLHSSQRQRAAKPVFAWLYIYIRAYIIYSCTFHRTAIRYIRKYRHHYMTKRKKIDNFKKRRSEEERKKRQEDQSQTQTKRDHTCNHLSPLHSTQGTTSQLGLWILAAAAPAVPAPVLCFFEVRSRFEPLPAVLVVVVAVACLLLLVVVV